MLKALAHFPINCNKPFLFFLPEPSSSLCLLFYHRLCKLLNSKLTAMYLVRKPTLVYLFVYLFVCFSEGFQSPENRSSDVFRSVTAGSAQPTETPVTVLCTRLKHIPHSVFPQINLPFYSDSNFPLITEISCYCEVQNAEIGTEFRQFPSCSLYFLQVINIWRTS